MSRSGDPLQTPFMRQYLELKASYTDAILFFRMGDFYELFLDDAVIAAPLMDVVLTKRQADIPMCGVPYHSADIYIQRLLAADKKIAIAEQMADPNNPKLMSRRVVRVVSAGTLIEDNLLNHSASSYLMAVAGSETDLGVAIAEISTGEFFALKLNSDSEPIESKESIIAKQIQESKDTEKPNEFNLSEIRDIYSSYKPTELLTTVELSSILKNAIPELNNSITILEGYKASPAEGWRKIEQLFDAKPKALGFDSNQNRSLGAVSLILHYLNSAFPENRPQLEPPSYLQQNQNQTILDEKTIKNLNLLEPKETSLISLFQCVTSPGRRLLQKTLLQPLSSVQEIHNRQSAVEWLIGPAKSRLPEVSGLLSTTYDLERSLSRMDGNRGRPADFRSIVTTVHSALKLKELITVDKNLHFEFFLVPKSLVDLANLLDSQIVEEPAALPGVSPFLKDNIDSKLDEAKKARNEGSNWILSLEKKEREATNISNLKIKYNKVSGYFIEISKGQTQNAPSYYERKQTLVTGERYTTTELKEIERKILSADAIIEESEQLGFDRLLQEVLNFRTEIRQLMSKIAYVDVLLSFANLSLSARWVKPEIVTTGDLIIEESRHPVVEKFLPTGSRFTPNDVNLNQTNQSFALLTGPNMAGKSTYIRQVAIIQLLAQIGCNVPAKRARLTPVDRIFTRIGAGDDLARGESTFFVEMLETSSILRNFTEKSLIIMDEVGRGTSTYDGLSIAWAISEHLTQKAPRPKVLFATHYHELTALKDRLGFVTLTMDVHESDGKVIFLHRVKPGVADKSYGIHVARLAGLPSTVIHRATELLEALETKSLQESETLQLNTTPQLFDSHTKPKRQRMNADTQPNLF
ncbi:MAG: DNA mismatch repair protein MutS [Leptonema sp. (in: Bacteria)]|nr:DNA mismatch repair protein MutS [Leptonema sp. (in: bacteria)]